MSIWRKYSWDTNRGTYRVDDSPIIIYYFFTCIEISSDYLEWDIRIGELFISEVFHEILLYLFSLDTSLLHIDIDETYESNISSYLFHLMARISTCIKSCNKCTHARPSDKRWNESQSFEPTYHTDMCESTGCSSTKYEGKFLRH